MRRDLRIALLSAGAVLGLAGGFHSLRARHWARQLAWERHMADVCLEAARAAPPAGRTSSLLPPGDEPGR